MSTAKDDQPQPQRPRWGVLKRLCLVAPWMYFAFVCALLIAIWLAADRWWVATVLMYGPRWIWGAPLVVLVPLAVLLRGRVWVPVALSCVIMMFGVMRLCVPLHGRGEAHADRTLRVMTCNVDYRNLDTSAFAQLVRQVRPDIVLAQAWSSVHDSAFADGGWHTRRDGELFIASRLPLLRAEASNDGAFVGKNGALARYRVGSSFGLDVDLYNFHAATPREGLAAVAGGWWKGAATVAANTDDRRSQSRIASEIASRNVAPAIVAGDFNMPTDSTIYRAFWSDWTNAFSAAGFGFGYTHYTRRTQLRIDHILVNAGWRVRRCYVAPNVGSAHRPVIAELEWSVTP